MSDAAEQDCPGHAKVCKADCTSVPHPQCHHLASRMEVICWFWCLWHIQAYWGRLWHPLSGLIHTLSLSDVTAMPSEGAQLAETNLREYKPQQIAAGYQGGRRGCWLCWVSSINSIPSDTGDRGWTIEVFPFVTPALQGHESQHQWAVSYAKGYKGGSKGLTIAWLLRGKLRQSWVPSFCWSPILTGDLGNPDSKFSPQPESNKGYNCLDPPSNPSLPHMVPQHNSFLLDFVHES